MKKQMFALMAAAAMFTVSCKKEGCMDSNAKNYDSKAKKNATCNFEGSVIFWYDKTTAEELTADGAISLTYYVNGEIVGSSAVSVYYTGAPGCGQQGTVSKTYDLGSEKSRSYPYQVKDQTGFKYYEGTVTIVGNECLQQQLR